jgi:hypothetical protein
MIHHTPPYLKLIAELARLDAFPPGSVSVGTVYHDDACPRLQGGHCCCNPDVRVRPISDGVA